MKKIIKNKLIKQFESAINEYLLLVNLTSNKDVYPNFEKIEKFIKKNEFVIKENDRGYYARQLKEFYQYLKTLNGDDKTIILLDFYEGNKTTVLSGNAAEGYKKLFKKIENHLPNKNPITKHSSFRDGIKNTVNYASVKMPLN